VRSPSPWGNVLDPLHNLVQSFSYAPDQRESVKDKQHNPACHQDINDTLRQIGAEACRRRGLVELLRCLVLVSLDAAQQSCKRRIRVFNDRLMRLSVVGVQQKVFHALVSLHQPLKRTGDVGDSLKVESGCPRQNGRVGRHCRTNFGLLAGSVLGNVNRSETVLMGYR
jgi:hypothetical protein